ncbi:MAG: LCP family protein [Kineosporiaceae bacterium]
MTQVVPPSSRRAQHDQVSRHASPARPASPEASDDFLRGRHATPWGQGFTRTVGWTFFGALVPGAGLIATGKQRAGKILLGGTAGLIGAAALLILFTDPKRLATRLLSDPNKLLFVVGGLLLLLIAWMGTVLLTHASARRYAVPTRSQRLMSTLMVASLLALVALPTAKLGGDVLIARDLLTSVFGNGGVSDDSQHPDSSLADPWANTPRVNVLLMGSDSGPDRIGVRPDTIIVASINTKTGDTVLVSLPRNLERAPFPEGSKQAAEYPDGFHCLNAAGENTECLLNALWQWGDEHKQYYPGDEHPGLTATVEAVQILTGLRIDDYVMLNLRGFAKFINAMGGITLNVKETLPIGDKDNPSEWIKTGQQHMDGYHALWYARSRATTSDFDRMRRQRCTIAAVVEQANPAKLAVKFPEVAAAMKTNLQTSIPLKDIDAWVTLSERVKKSQVRSLAFTDQVINTVHPDVDEMNTMVEKALNPPVKSTPSAPASGTPSPTKTKQSTTPSDSSTAENVKDLC